MVHNKMFIIRVLSPGITEECFLTLSLLFWFQGFLSWKLYRTKSRNGEKLTNFVIKEQGKCFELARTGRELILLLREDENNEGVEDLLNVRLSTALPILG